MKLLILLLVKLLDYLPRASRPPMLWLLANRPLVEVDVEEAGSAQLVTKDLINLLSLRVGVILASCLQEHVMGAVELKWPNDIFLNQKKVAGILCEVLWNDTKLSSDVIIGVGVNIKSFPPEYRSSATSVFLDGNQCLTADDFLQSFLQLLKIPS